MSKMHSSDYFRTHLASAVGAEPKGPPSEATVEGSSPVPDTGLDSRVVVAKGVKS
jgi:hypothetical protein